ncbi:MAG: hypothetical protein AAF823_07895 [Planctomycetota bacterium]
MSRTVHPKPHWLNATGRTAREALAAFGVVFALLVSGVAWADGTDEVVYRETFPRGSKTLANVGWSLYVGGSARDASGASAISGDWGDRTAPTAVNAGEPAPQQARGFAYVKEGIEGTPYLLCSDEMPPVKQPLGRVSWLMNPMDSAAAIHPVVCIDRDGDGRPSAGDAWLASAEPFRTPDSGPQAGFVAHSIAGDAAWVELDFRPGRSLPASLRSDRLIEAWPEGPIVSVGFYSLSRIARPRFDSVAVHASGLAEISVTASPESSARVGLDRADAVRLAKKLLARHAAASPAASLAEAWPAMTRAWDRHSAAAFELPWSPQIDPPVAGRVFYVHASSGDDAADGRSPQTAWRTLQAAVDRVQPGDALIVGPGSYYQPTLRVRDRAGTAQRPIYIRAEPLGEATVSSAWPDAAEGLVEWHREADGVWSAPFPARKRDPKTFGGFVAADGTEYMLFGMRSLADLLSDKAPIWKQWDRYGPDRPMPWPGYGFALEAGRCWLRTPNGEDPNGKRVVIATHADHESSAVHIDNSPHVILDGLRFEGAGDKAVKAERNSPYLTVRNAVIEYCRHGVGPDDHGLIEWSEYTFPGYKRFADELVRRVRADGVRVANPMFGWVKRYHGARTEGHLLGRPWTAPRNNRGVGPRFCEGRFNFSHQAFDGDAPGAWSDSRVHSSVYLYTYDNAIEMEAGRHSPGRNVHVHDNLIIASLYGTISHQDTTDLPMGPQYVYRNVILGNFPEGYRGPDRVVTGPVDSADDAWQPWVVCKFLAPNANAITYAHNFIWMRGGGLIWKKPETASTRRKMAWVNNVIAFDQGLTNYEGQHAFRADANAWVGPGQRRDLQGPRGLNLGSLSSLELRDIDALDLRPLPGSPLIDAAGPMQDLQPAADGRPDIGPFEAGTFDGPVPGDTWPRPRVRVFNAAFPQRLTGSSEPQPVDLVYPDQRTSGSPSR